MTPKEFLQALRGRGVTGQVDGNILRTTRCGITIETALNGKQFPIDPGAVTMIEAWHVMRESCGC